MKNYLFLKRLSATTVLAILLNSGSNCQTLLIENFSYPAGTALTTNGWSAHSGQGTNPVKVHSYGLSFTGYPTSNIGLSAILNNTGEDVNRSFTTVTSGSVYCAFLIRVDTLAEDYFLHFVGSPVGTNFKGKVNVKGTGGTFNFGLLKGTGTPAYTTGSPYTTGTTYLLVLKYSILEGTKNDSVSLFICTGSIPGSEPLTPSLGPLKDGSDDLTNVSGIALRQNSSVMDLIVDGIRIATKWEDAVSSLTAIKNSEPGNRNLVYPTPASYEINIENCHDVSEIEIISLSGRKLIMAKNNSNLIVKIPVNQLIQGLYIIRLKATGGYRYLKFIKS